MVRTTRYVGNVEFVIESGVTRTRRYLAGGAVVTTASNLPGQVEDRWVLTDHLGSSDVVVNDAGAVVESTGFDAWGLRRNAGNATVPGTALATTIRGFTSHEHFDAIGLVHMNGRVYDPNLGRFIQSDPIDDRGIQVRIPRHSALDSTACRAERGGKVVTIFGSGVGVNRRCWTAVYCA